MFSTRDEVNEFLLTLTELVAPEELPKTLYVPHYIADDVLNGIGVTFDHVQIYGAKGIATFRIVKLPAPTDTETKLQDAYKQIAALKKQLYSKER